jgi:hypothetical protein
MQHLCSDLSTSFHQATSRSVLRCRASRTDGGTDSAAEVLKTGTKFGYAHDLLELGEDDQRSWGWENSHVIIGLLWFTMVYFMLFHFFWRFYGFRDFWRCPMILNGGIWRYMIGKYEITRRVFFFTCDFWVKFSLKALRYCNFKKWCGDSAQLLYLCGFPCTLKFWPGPMWKSAQSPAAILYTNDGRARCYSWVCR